MDALDEQEFQAHLLEGNNEILIHCCGLENIFSVTVPSLPFLQLRVCICHFSFHESPSERRSCILPLSETLLQKLHDVYSPCVARVKSSVLYKFLEDEVELEIDQIMLLIWDFDVLSTTAPDLSPQLFTAETQDIQFAPLIDTTKCDCNCSRFPNTGYIFENNDGLVEQSSVEGDTNSIDLELLNDDDDANDDVGNNEEEEEVEEVTHTLPFKCIGAAHERHRQEELEKAHTALHEQHKNVQVKLRPEPSNEKDSEAIAIDMDYGCGFVNVGYIASELTKYIHPLLQSGDIINVSVEHILFRVYFLKVGFYPKILLTRKGTWDRYIIWKSKSVR